MHKQLFTILAAAVLLSSATAHAAAPSTEPTPQYILTHANTTHKLVFDLGATSTAGGLNAGLGALAELRDLYRSDGVADKDVSIVVVIHAAATDIVRSAASYRGKGLGPDNPNLALMRKLAGEGVFFIVSKQSLALRQIAEQDIEPVVHIGPSADLIFFNFEENGYVYSGTGSLFKD